MCLTGNSAVVLMYLIVSPSAGRWILLCFNTKVLQVELVHNNFRSGRNYSNQSHAGNVLFVPNDTVMFKKHVVFFLIHKDFDDIYDYLFVARG